MLAPNPQAPTPNPRCRVVVTGMGAVTPLGAVADLWASLLAGRSGVGRITRFDASGLRCRIAAEVRNLEPPEGLDDRLARRLDRSALFGLAAALDAWEDSCLSSVGPTAHKRTSPSPTRTLSSGLASGGPSWDPYEIGVLIGSSHGGETSMLAEAPAALGAVQRRVSARLIPRMLSNMAAAEVAMYLKLRGPAFGVSSACATGAHAIGEAAEIIRRGDAVAMVCGGTDACITPITVAGDLAAGALSCRNEAPEAASRPFDAGRDGFVIGEGAGVLVLEEQEHAVRRGARIYGEVAGYGATADAFHETRPDPSGEPAARAMRRALEKAGVGPEEVDAVFAHATGTIAGDRAEGCALRLLFGDGLEAIPVTAIKGGLGHLMGAAGAVQAIVALKALEGQILPPTVNLASPDPLCPPDVVRGAPRPRAMDWVLSNAFGFGGHNVALIFSRTSGSPP